MIRRATVLVVACGALAFPVAGSAQSPAQEGYAPVPGVPPTVTPQPPAASEGAPPPVQETLPAVVTPTPTTPTPTTPPQTTPPRTTQQIPDQPTKPPPSIGGPATPTFTPIARTTPSPRPSGQLPYTGLDLGLLTAAGVVLLAVGLLLRRVTAR